MPPVPFPAHTPPSTWHRSSAGWLLGLAGRSPEAHALTTGAEHTAGTWTRSLAWLRTCRRRKGPSGPWRWGGRVRVGHLSGRAPPNPRPKHSPVLHLDVWPCGVHQLLPIPFSLEVHHLGLEAGAGGGWRGGRGWGSPLGHWGARTAPPRAGETPRCSDLGFPPSPPRDPSDLTNKKSRSIS